MDGGVLSNLAFEKLPRMEKVKSGGSSPVTTRRAAAHDDGSVAGVNQKVPAPHKTTRTPAAGESGAEGTLQIAGRPSPPRAALRL